MADLAPKEEKSLNFIEEIIEGDIQIGKHQGRVHTRFPPEPNGYLHIGHAKAITVNFGIAQRYHGLCNLRFDDTNPVAEEVEYVDSIREDVRWLGFEWANECYASDYFEQLYAFALQLIRMGLAYVDDSTPEEIAAMKGTPVQPGTESPYRNRSIEENLALFDQMKAGAFPDGARVLRAKIDMAAPNMHMRDPVLYRIKHAHHHRTGNQWVIYPMYDFAHGQSDSIEKITHSLCSLEFRHHRPLYDWLIQQLGIFPSRQIEFARMNVSYMITSKRKLLRLVQEGIVNGWDDPRMPTLSGLRRRGYPPQAVVNFCERAGVAKRDNVIEVELLEFSAREILNKTATRAMAVLDPLKVVIVNYPEGETEWLDTENNPEDPASGTRKIPFTRELFIEQEDFMENPPKNYFRLSPGQMTRLKSAYIIRCDEAVRDPHTGAVTALRCTYFPESRSGTDTSGLKVKGVMHWVAAAHAVPIEVRLYDRLFTDPTPTEHEDKDFMAFINPDSLKVFDRAIGEPTLGHARPGDQFQFLRKGYFAADPDSSQGRPVFNLTVQLKDTWAKEKK
jgi:glutaminyl-tRNA synthetase